MEDGKKKGDIYSHTDTSKVNLTDEQWKEVLPAEVYNIAREKGTEWAFTGKYWNSKENGSYYCAACGNPLFISDAKFDSSCGWPSFFQPLTKTSVIYAPDNSHGMHRTEVLCGRCKSHLGHVFDDGPPPTGLRYCINSVILDFEKAQEADEHYQQDNKTNDQEPA
ncbi:peptide-methionine (R)-S-oxide reductase MsrB [Chitinophaga arvensicola]|uniref:Peptide methionine sulfoxide reductase MsrB n=1 Tax=Chitinophaga arvensicola TaxID=29529 RepID=A0A1I0P6X3_9BACT|nr:peptide-methionine (R)-S-oxide reductase MsrB [Chitinophaga arvensicola]SEW09766.1 peptide-methionine (R)-S-oxide reductase [Chitinophaga arvensicola]